MAKFLTSMVFEFKGAHSQVLAYSIRDIVMSEDGSKVYFASQDVPAGIPLSDESFWKLMIDLTRAAE